MNALGVTPPKTKSPAELDAQLDRIEEKLNWLLIEVRTAKKENLGRATKTEPALKPNYILPLTKANECGFVIMAMITTETNKPGGYVSAVFRRLIKLGLLEKHSRAVYKITEQGQAHLKSLPR